jgi:hypothetical protein
MESTNELRMCGEVEGPGWSASTGAEVRARLEVLARLLDRLTAPDLTLDEAKGLRARLLDLLPRVGDAPFPGSTRPDPQAAA